MVFNDTTTRQGLIQDAEDICGLGATGITGNTALFQQFTRWANKWNQIAVTNAIKSSRGWDVDDPAYSTYASGTYPGTTNRDYAISSTEKVIGIKTVGISTDGTNYVWAEPMDITDRQNIAKDANIDGKFSKSAPKYDPKANSVDIYPKFTAAEVAAGAKVYIEFYREPSAFATSGTDTQTPAVIAPYHQLISKGMSYEYAALYKPDLASRLSVDIYGNGGNIKGILKEMEEWYWGRYPRRTMLSAKVKNYE